MIIVMLIQNAMKFCISASKESIFWGHPKVHNRQLIVTKATATAQQQSEQQHKKLKPLCFHYC